MTGETVAQVLDRVLDAQRCPARLRWIMGRNSNHAPWRIGPIGEAFNSTSFDRANRWKMPSLNRFNGRLRDECLNVHQFASLAEAQALIEAWRVDYNPSVGHTAPTRAPDAESEVRQPTSGKWIVEKSSALVRTVSEQGPTSWGRGKRMNRASRGVVHWGKQWSSFSLRRQFTETGFGQLFREKQAKNGEIWSF